MKCPECNVQQLLGTAKPIKEGYLLKHKKRIFGKNWKEKWVVLHEDSTIAWYKDKHKDKLISPNGTIMLKEAPEMLAAGRFVFRIPGAPSLPPGATYFQLMAFGTKNHFKIHWFLASSEDEVNEWMSAISNTLPLAPSTKLEAVTIRVRNDKIMIYNNEGVHIGSIRSNMKAAQKKCKSCCTSCDKRAVCATPTNQDKDNDKATTTNCCSNSNSRNGSKSTNTSKMLCETGTGLLMGTASASVTTSWRGWGEGLGWNISGLSGATYNSADHTIPSLPYDFDDAANGTISTIEHSSELMESAVESTGILAFDFFL
ncbi:uncharacterized protein LOC135843128 [Planococcus citri]|uniref:uncharacterized protein LOC135843128 n=1 Tax=Planococcus citri TaxID=170843 RepID=UPI0031F955EB